MNVKIDIECDDEDTIIVHLKEIIRQVRAERKKLHE